MKRGGFAVMGTLACALMLAAALPAMAAPPSQAAEKTGDGPGVAETAKGTGEVRTDGDVPADVGDRCRVHYVPCESRRAGYVMLNRRAREYSVCCMSR